jgi:hypothetical protein
VGLTEAQLSHKLRGTLCNNYNSLSNSDWRVDHVIAEVGERYREDVVDQQQPDCLDHEGESGAVVHFEKQNDVWRNEQSGSDIEHVGVLVE